MKDQFDSQASNDAIAESLGLSRFAFIPPALPVATKLVASSLLINQFPSQLTKTTNEPIEQVDLPCNQKAMRNITSCYGEVAARLNLHRTARKAEVGQCELGGTQSVAEDTGLVLSRSGHRANNYRVNLHTHSSATFLSLPIRTTSTSQLVVRQDESCQSVNTERASSRSSRKVASGENYDLSQRACEPETVHFFLVQNYKN